MGVIKRSDFDFDFEEISTLILIFVSRLVSIPVRMIYMVMAGRFDFNFNEFFNSSILCTSRQFSFSVRMISLGTIGSFYFNFDFDGE